MKPQRYRQIVEEIKQPMFWWSSFVLVLWKILIYHSYRKLIQHRYIWSPVMNSREIKKMPAYDLNYMAETGLLSMNQMNKENQYFQVFNWLILLAGGSYVGFCHQRTVGAKNAESTSI
jgi:hypothetical protein